jgi:hypothetical protein
MRAVPNKQRAGAPRRHLISCAMILSASFPIRATAQSPYCEKVHARASADAAVLIAPRVFGTGMRFPPPSEQPADATTYQVRIGLALSPIDAYRGVKLIGIGDADCEAHELGEELRRSLDDGTDGPKLEAYRAQIEFLAANQPAWSALIEKAKERIAIHVITTLELEDLQRKADGLARTLAQARGFVQQLEARGVTTNPGAGQKAEDYLDTQMRVESRMTSLKNLDAWGFKLSGGVVPQLHGSVEWFGWAELSYSLGGPIGQSSDNDYLRARREELETARYELPARIRLLGQQVDAELSMAQRELAIVDREQVFLSRTAKDLTASDAVSSQQARDEIVLDQFATQSEQVYLQTLITKLALLRGNQKHE